MSITVRGLISYRAKVAQSTHLVGNLSDIYLSWNLYAAWWVLDKQIQNEGAHSLASAEGGLRHLCGEQTG